MLAAVLPTLPYKRQFQCTLGTPPVADHAAGYLYGRIIRLLATKGLIRFTTSAYRQHIELETDVLISEDEAADIAGFCDDYDLARARAFPA